MNADAKREEIKKYYGTDNFRGKNLYLMPDNQIFAIYQSMLARGDFEKYESLRQSYIDLFPDDRYSARRRACTMSIFDLRRAIPEVIKSKMIDGFPEGYQFTLDDILNNKEEEKDGNSNEASAEKQSV